MDRRHGQVGVEEIRGDPCPTGRADAECGGTGYRRDLDTVQVATSRPSTQICLTAPSNRAAT